MAKTFNCGIGAVLVVSQSDANHVVQQVKSQGHGAVIIGHVLPKQGHHDTKQKMFVDLQCRAPGALSNFFCVCAELDQVEIKNLDESLRKSFEPRLLSNGSSNGELKVKKRVGVLISGSGNMCSFRQEDLV